jgi:acyl-CoA thioester hydrolase
VVNDISPGGRFEGAAHRFPVRVYFEDTDLSGVVYHANYLRYMERARSDMLRALGIEQRVAFEAGEGVYAVSALSIKYRRPARLDDDLVVVSHVTAVGAATATIHQSVMRTGEILTEAEVTAAFLTLEGKPRRQPKEWVAAFGRLNQEN